MELKGSTIFYTQISRETKTSVNVTRKIDLSLSSEISLTPKNQIHIAMQKSHGGVYLLRIPKEKHKSTPEETSSTVAATGRAHNKGLYSISNLADSCTQLYTDA